MPALARILLGIIDIAIVITILVLVGAIIVMFARWLQWPIDWNVQRLYLLVVALIALYMLVALLLGMPSVRLLGFQGIADTVLAALSTGAAADL
jgi:hypothetical protein